MKKQTKQQLEDHIMEVDFNHGKLLSDMDKRLSDALDKIAQLEYKLEYIKQTVERQPAWLNQPVVPTPPFRVDINPLTGEPYDCPPTITM